METRVSEVPGKEMPSIDSTFRHAGTPTLRENCRRLYDSYYKAEFPNISVFELDYGFRNCWDLVLTDFETWHSTGSYWLCASIPNQGHDICCPTCLEHIGICNHGLDYLRCWQRPEKERIFANRKSLAQHLTAVHDFNTHLSPKPTLVDSSDILQYLKRFHRSSRPGN